MVKGWRNDPRWIEHYKQRDAERIQRQIDRVKMEAQTMIGNMERKFRADQERLYKVRPRAECLTEGEWTGGV